MAKTPVYLEELSQDNFFILDNQLFLVSNKVDAAMKDESYQTCIHIETKEVMLFHKMTKVLFQERLTQVIMAN